MKAVKISLSYATRANEALEDNHNLFKYVEQLASNVYELHPDEEGIMDEKQLEYEISELLTSAGVPEDEFWFD